MLAAFGSIMRKFEINCGIEQILLISLTQPTNLFCVLDDVVVHHKLILTCLTDNNQNFRNLNNRSRTRNLLRTPVESLLKLHLAYNDTHFHPCRSFPFDTDRCVVWRACESYGAPLHHSLAYCCNVKRWQHPRRKRPSPP